MGAEQPKRDSRPGNAVVDDVGKKLLRELKKIDEAWPGLTSMIALYGSWFDRTGRLGPYCTGSSFPPRFNWPVLIQ